MSGYTYLLLQTRNEEHDRYLLTFANADVAETWWRAIQASPKYSGVSRMYHSLLVPVDHIAQAHKQNNRCRSPIFLL